MTITVNLSPMEAKCLKCLLEGIDRGEIPCQADKNNADYLSVVVDNAIHEEGVACIRQ